MSQEAPITRDEFIRFVDKMIGDESYDVLEVHFQKGKIPRIKCHGTLLSEDVKRLISNKQN
ncbi:MAG: hypothetical protein KCHDKBKB_01598 [Elusimicrobia bacterium]|nr:hypothetical protein [Elusimicrobiota bacterium]